MNCQNILILGFLVTIVIVACVAIVTGFPRNMTDVYFKNMSEVKSSDWYDYFKCIYTDNQLQEKLPFSVNDLWVIQTKFLPESLKELKQNDVGRMIAQFIRDQRRLQPTFESTIAAYLDKVAGLVADAYLERQGPKQLTGESQVIIDTVDTEALEKELRGIYGEYYAEVAAATVNSINGTLGAQIGLPDPVAAQIVAEGGTRAGLIDLPRTTREKLFTILAQAQEDGVGVDEIARRIRSTVTAGPWSTVKTRARVIARTETLNAQRKSALATYNQMDPNAPVQVFDALLGETDEECEILNGAVVSQLEAERLAASEHPNGTRGFVIVQ